MLDNTGVPEQLSDYRNLHYPIDYGFCSCGKFCETCTRFYKHLQEVIEENNPKNNT
jgi:hypothetical protein